MLKNGAEILEIQIRRWAEKKGDYPVVIEAETGETLTYSQLKKSKDALNAFLKVPGKTILLTLSGGVADSIIWAAALTGGHRLIPLSPSTSPSDLQKALNEYKPDLVIKPGSLAKFKRIVEKKHSVADIPRPTQGFVYLTTSGSTGIPKGILLSASQIVKTAQNIIKSHQLKEDDRGFTSLPFYHVNAPVVSLITTLLSGSSLVIAAKYSTTNFWAWIEKYDPTWISLVPTIIAMLLSTPKPSCLSHAHLRFIRTASEPLPVGNLKRFEEKFGIPVIETYGLTEAASTIAANPPPPQIHKAGSVGLPVGVSIQICSPDTKQKLSHSQVGEVWVKGENVIKEYAGGLVDKASFEKGWFRTGDMGYLDADGYLHLTGRIKDIIIRGGENIAPREIEEVLLSHPKIREATVVGLPDPIYGELVAAFVVLHPGKNAGILDKIHSFASRKLAKQKVPEKIIILEQLPRNKTGKVDKVELRKFTKGSLPASN